jgi:hypothetical protein
MSKNNNVNPGQYKVAGRERPDTLAQERIKGGKEKTAASSQRPKPRRNTRKQA